MKRIACTPIRPFGQTRLALRQDAEIIGVRPANGWTVLIDALVDEDKPLVLREFACARPWTTVPDSARCVGTVVFTDPNIPDQEPYFVFDLGESSYLEPRQ